MQVSEFLNKYTMNPTTPTPSVMLCPKLPFKIPTSIMMVMLFFNVFHVSSCFAIVHPVTSYLRCYQLWLCWATTKSGGTAGSPWSQHFTLIQCLILIVLDQTQTSCLESWLTDGFRENHCREAMLVLAGRYRQHRETILIAAPADRRSYSETQWK